MQLFDPEPIELLPHDGSTSYLGQIMTEEEARSYFDVLLNRIAWKHDEAKLFGKHYITKRKAAWYGNDNYKYSYSNTTKEALAWTPELLKLKTRVETVSNDSYNSCLLNLYHDGNEGIAWHSDDEKTLKPRATIASLSLGAVRKFSFKHKETQETVSVMLENGSLLLMQGATQENWLHRLPPTKKVYTPRINLTFRTILW